MLSHFYFPILRENYFSWLHCKKARAQHSNKRQLTLCFIVKEKTGSGRDWRELERARPQVKWAVAIQHQLLCVTLEGDPSVARIWFFKGNRKFCVYESPNFRRWNQFTLEKPSLGQHCAKHKTPICGPGINFKLQVENHWSKC